MSMKKEELTFKNGELAVVANTISNFKLKGRASLGRTWLIKKLSEFNKQFNDDKTATQKIYFQTDEDGDFVYQADKKTLILNKDYTMDEAEKEFNNLINEKVQITVSSYSERVKALYNALADYPYELDGQTAEVYAILFDELDKAFGKGDK